MSTKENVYASDLSDDILLNRTLTNDINWKNLMSDITELNDLLLTAKRQSVIEIMSRVIDKLSLECAKFVTSVNEIPSNKVKWS
jgi:hypothetical protein